MLPNPDASQSKPRVAVVGAGWAGLTAAFTLKRTGCHVEVFEQSSVLGGRARKAVIPRSGIILDNGQHLMLGAYRHVLELMQQVGMDLSDTLLRIPLQLHSLDDQIRLQVNASHPAPLRLPLALLRMQGFRARHKLQLILALLRLKLAGWKVAPQTTVLQWLQQQRQHAMLVQRFWEPLCVATLNTPIEAASMTLFSRVLKDSLAARPDDSDLIFPRVDLSALWPEALLSQLTIHTNTPVRGITCTQSGYQLQTASESAAANYDAVILATPPLVCHRLLKGLQHGMQQSSVAAATSQEAEKTPRPVGHIEDEDASALLQQLAAFQYHAIATLTLFLEAPFPLPEYMYLLREDRQRGHDGQWLFNRSRFMQAEQKRYPASPSSLSTSAFTTSTSKVTDTSDAPMQASSIAPQDAHAEHSIAVVISHADHLAGKDRDTIALAILAQIQDQLPAGEPMPAMLSYELILEKRATFAATPQLQRPANETPWPGLYLAGDWTNTGYPGVLEGAVMSGLSAARALHA